MQLRLKAAKERSGVDKLSKFIDLWREHATDLREKKRILSAAAMQFRSLSAELRLERRGFDAFASRNPRCAPCQLPARQWLPTPLTCHGASRRPA